VRQGLFIYEMTCKTCKTNTLRPHGNTVVTFFARTRHNFSIHIRERERESKGEEANISLGFRVEGLGRVQRTADQASKRQGPGQVLPRTQMGPDPQAPLADTPHPPCMCMCVIDTYIYVCMYVCMYTYIHIAS